MEKFRRFLHPVWTGFVLLIAAYVLRGVFLCARDTFLYNRLDLCDPADFKIYHRNTEPKRWRSLVHTYRLYGTLYPEIRNADMRVGYDAYSRYAIGDTIRVYATSSGRVVPVSTVEKMRIWHIGSRGLASEHFPGAVGVYRRRICFVVPQEPAQVIIFFAGKPRRGIRRQAAATPS